MISFCKSQRDFEQLLTQWGVPCAVTGEMLPIYKEEVINGVSFYTSNLKYWDVAKQEFYASPYVVPANQTKPLEKAAPVDTSRVNTEEVAL